MSIKGGKVISAEQGQPIRLNYLALDTSGSTIRGGWIAACNGALPDYVGNLERESVGGIRNHLCILTYGDRCAVVVPLDDVSRINRLPALVPEGFSSLASGFAALRDTISADTAQLDAD